MSLNRKTTIQRRWNKFIRLKSPERNSTMFRCNRFQIKLQIQKPSIVNFKIHNSQKLQSILSFFLGRILWISTSRNLWNFRNWCCLFAVFLNSLYTLRAKDSQLRGNSLYASLAHRCSESHIHLEICMPGHSFLNLVATEFLMPIIVLQPSDANPIIFAVGILWNFSGVLRRPSKCSAVALSAFVCSPKI